MAKDHSWEPGTLYDNIDAAVKAIGSRSPGIVWGLANVEWPTVADRDAFLSLLRKKGNQ